MAARPGRDRCRCRIRPIRRRGCPRSPPPARDPAVYYLTGFVQRLADKQMQVAAAAPGWVQGGGDPQQLDALVKTFQADYLQWAIGWELYIKHSTDRGATWSADTRLTTA